MGCSTKLLWTMCLQSGGFHAQVLSYVLPPLHNTDVFCLTQMTCGLAVPRSDEEGCAMLLLLVHRVCVRVPPIVPRRMNWQDPPRGGVKAGTRRTCVPL
jgi:hypothetical protein